jgi:hypothetical protein
VIKNEAPTRFRAVLSCGRIKITTGVLPVFTSSTMRRSLWLILPTTPSDDGVATGSFWSRARPRSVGPTWVVSGDGGGLAAAATLDGRARRSCRYTAHTYLFLHHHHHLTSPLGTGAESLVPCPAGQHCLAYRLSGRHRSASTPLVSVRSCALGVCERSCGVEALFDQ